MVGSGQLPVDMRQLKDGPPGKLDRHGRSAAHQLRGACHMTQVGNYGEPGAAGTWGSGTNQNGAPWRAAAGSRMRTPRSRRCTSSPAIGIPRNSIRCPGSTLGDKATNRLRHAVPGGTWVTARGSSSMGGDSVMGNAAIDLSGAAVANLVSGNLVDWIEAWDQGHGDVRPKRPSRRPGRRRNLQSTSSWPSRGAILFPHQEPVGRSRATPARPKPLGGNGSLRGPVHGAYSPRYVNDPNYLESPDFRGHRGPHQSARSHRPRIPRGSTHPEHRIHRRLGHLVVGPSPSISRASRPPADKTPAEEAADDNKGADRPAGAAYGRRLRLGSPEWAFPLVGWLAPPLYGCLGQRSVFPQWQRPRPSRRCWTPASA